MVAAFGHPNPTWLHHAVTSPEVGSRIICLYRGKAHGGQRNAHITISSSMIKHTTYWGGDTPKGMGGTEKCTYYHYL